MESIFFFKFCYAVGQRNVGAVRWRSEMKEVLFVCLFVFNERYTRECLYADINGRNDPVVMKEKAKEAEGAEEISLR